MAAAPVAHEFALVPLADLRQHEEVEGAAEVGALAERIARDGFVAQPIVADRRTLVVLDGHHRLNALRHLGLRCAPVYLVDYMDPAIRVESWRDEEQPPTKETVIERALSGKPLPAKATKHTALYGFPKRNVPLVDLR